MRARDLQKARAPYRRTRRVFLALNFTAEEFSTFEKGALAAGGKPMAVYARELVLWALQQKMKRMTGVITLGEP